MEVGKKSSNESGILMSSRQSSVFVLPGLSVALVNEDQCRPETFFPWL